MIESLVIYINFYGRNETVLVEVETAPAFLRLQKPRAAKVTYTAPIWKDPRVDLVQVFLVFFRLWFCRFE